jgi:hypothetical protein
MSRWRLGLAALLALLPILSLVVGQTVGPFNEREVKKQTNTQDIDLGEKLWVMDVRFKDPRLITVDIPGRGKRVVWYLWYQLINNTGEPRQVIPRFELVTIDKQTNHLDQIIPKALEAIKRVEDPHGYLDIKDSVTLARNPIPVTKPNSAPRPVTGVAMWDNIFADLPDTTRFSIFVSGLSNGYTEVDGKDGKTLRLKTLQLNFRRLSDRFHLDAEVKFVQPAEWLYRASTLKLPEIKVPDDAKPPEPPKAAEKEKEKEKEK